jgi:hypothetical protein
MIGFLFQAWAAFSPLASIVGTCGLALVVVAFLGSVFIPEKLKLPAIAVGVALIVGAMIWQAAEAKGAHDAFRAVAEANTKVLRERVEKADAITRDLAEQATHDLADAQVNALKLKELNDALAQDPRRNGACVPRDLSRRLRAL